MIPVENKLSETNPLRLDVLSLWKNCLGAGSRTRFIVVVVQYRCHLDHSEFARQLWLAWSGGFRSITLGTPLVKLSLIIFMALHLEALHGRWLQLLNKNDKVGRSLSRNTQIYMQKVPNDVSEKWFKRVTDHYNEPWRYYHTTKHIEELFEHYDKFQHKLKTPEICAFSIWFHE